MSDIRRIQVLESIASVAQESAERGQMDPAVYADVFEYIVDALHSLAKERCAV